MNNKNIISIVLVFFIFTAFSSWFVSYYVPIQTHNLYMNSEYSAYGWKDNYEKAMYIQAAEIQSQFWDISMDQLKKEVESQLWVSLDQNSPDDFWEEYTSLFWQKYFVWAENARYTVYEHSDFNCPYCNRFYESWVIEQLLENYPDELNYAYVNRPVIGWANSEMKAKATLCAWDLGWWDSFYAVHDWIFTNDYSSLPDISSWIIQDLSIDVEEFESCVESSEFDQVLAMSIEEWNTLWLSGTPWVAIVDNETWEYLTVKWAAPYSNFEDTLQELMN